MGCFFFNTLNHFIHLQHSSLVSVYWSVNFGELKSYNHPLQSSSRMVPSSTPRKVSSYYHLVVKPVLLPPQICLHRCGSAFSRMSWEYNHSAGALSVWVLHLAKCICSSFMLLCVSGKSSFLNHKWLNSRAGWNLKDQSQALSFPGEDTKTTPSSPPPSAERPLTQDQELITEQAWTWASPLV